MITHMRVVFRDADGEFIERFTKPTAEACASAADFMLLHGTDPDESGKQAAPGTIKFYPVTSGDA